MQSTITNKEKQKLIQRYHSGEPATTLCLQAGVPRSTFYTWLKSQSAVETSKPNPASTAELTNLRNRNGRLEQIIEVLKNVNCTAASPTQVKLAELEKLHGQYSVRVICDALDVPLGTFPHLPQQARE